MSFQILKDHEDTQKNKKKKNGMKRITSNSTLSWGFGNLEQPTTTTTTTTIEEEEEEIEKEETKKEIFVITEDIENKKSKTKKRREDGSFSPGYESKSSSSTPKDTEKFFLSTEIKNYNLLKQNENINNLEHEEKKININNNNNNIKENENYLNFLNNLEKQIKINEETIFQIDKLLSSVLNKKIVVNNNNIPIIDSDSKKEICGKILQIEEQIKINDDSILCITNLSKSNFKKFKNKVKTNF
jgi:hypothetical protein